MSRLRASAGGRGSTSLSLIHPEAIYDINFASGQWFGALPSDLVVSRASEALTLTPGGTYANFASNTARITGGGLMIEEARTNLFLNSTAPATQTITVVNGTTYTVGCFVAGSAALSDAGSGTATPGAPVTFVASSTSLTVTISGSPSYVNVSAASFSLSPIATAGTAATRPADVIYLPISGVGTEYTVYCVTASPPVGITTGRGFEAWASSSNRFGLAVSSANASMVYVSSGTVQGSGAGVVSYSSGRKVAARISGTNNKIAVDGTLGAVASIVPAPVAAPTRLYLGSSSGGASGYLNANVSRIAIIPRAMSDAELQTLTT